MPNTTNNGRQYITTIEAEQISGLRRNYLTLLLREGKLEGFRPARDWFIYTDSLERFLASDRKPGPPQGSRRKKKELDRSHATSTPDSKNL
jgi:hypothetical protein